MIRDRWFQIMRKLPRLGTSKYFIAGSVYLTPKKIANIVKCEIECRRRVLKPESHPYIIVLDVTNVCNLRCPYCPTGAGQRSGRKASMMTADFVAHLLDHLGDYAVMLYLYNWGEPLLNPEIADIVRVAHDRGIFTSMSSNLSVKCDSRLEEMCDAGLDHIDPSIDGGTQEVYEIYRKFGDIELVFENIKRIVAHRKAAGRSNPVIDWQYLDFEHNHHEIPAARMKAKELGVDRFFTRHGCTPDDNKDDQDAHSFGSKKYSCELLWRSIVVNADSGVAPCCYMYDRSHDFGRVDEQSIQDVRHNETYVMARRLFDDRRAHELPPDLLHPCLLCGVAEDKPHLAKHIKFNAENHRAKTNGSSSKESKVFVYKL